MDGHVIWFHFWSRQCPGELSHTWDILWVCGVSCRLQEELLGQRLDAPVVLLEITMFLVLVSHHCVSLRPHFLHLAWAIFLRHTFDNSILSSHSNPFRGSHTQRLHGLESPPGPVLSSSSSLPLCVPSDLGEAISFLFLFVWFLFFETRFCYVIQDGLELLLVLLHQPLTC